MARGHGGFLHISLHDDRVHFLDPEDMTETSGYLLMNGANLRRRRAASDKQTDNLETRFEDLVAAAMSKLHRLSPSGHLAYKKLPKLVTDSCDLAMSAEPSGLLTVEA